jgi:hypothetical protein
MDKGTALGKRDTTLPHRGTFSMKIIPATDKRLDEEDMARLKPRMKKVGGTLISDGCQSTTNKPVINVILGVDGRASSNGSHKTRSKGDRRHHPIMAPLSRTRQPYKQKPLRMPNLPSTAHGHM